MLQQCLARRHDYDPRPLVMADRGRDSSGRGDDRYRQPDRSRDTDRYRDDRYDHNSRSLPSKWDWDQSGDRGGRDDRHRGQGHRRPRSRDRDTRPNKRVRNNGNTAEGKPRHTFKDSINARLGDVGKEKKLSLDIGDEDDFFKLDEEGTLTVTGTTGTITTVDRSRQSGTGTKVAIEEAGTTGTGDRGTDAHGQGTGIPDRTKGYETMVTPQRANQGTHSKTPSTRGWGMLGRKKSSRSISATRTISSSWMKRTT